MPTIAELQELIEIEKMKKHSVNKDNFSMILHMSVGPDKTPVHTFRIR